MKTWHKVLVGVGVLVGAYLLGRYSAPEKIKIEEKIVEVIKEVKVEDKKKDIKIVEVVKPDGTKETTTEIKEREKVVTNKDTVKEEEVYKEIIQSSRRVNFGLLFGVPLQQGIEYASYGLYANVSVVGPFSLGIWGLSNSTIGASIGLSF